MARRTRHFSPSATYHVMLRGNNGQPIFIAEADRCKFCLLMQEGVERYGHSILAFCFMNNHVHLAIQVQKVSLSKICQNLAFRYTRFYNWKYKTIGHLFQGRFKSILVDDNRYLKELIRYIHLNPVRANLVKDPFSYRWSSHKAYLTEQEFTWLARDTGLEKFGETRKEALQAFHDFVIAGIGKDDGLDFKRGDSEGILGDEMFIARSKNKTTNVMDENLYAIDLSTLLSIITEWYNVEVGMLQTPGVERRMAYIRSMGALLAREMEGISLNELDAFFRRTDGSMSQAASRLEARMHKSEAIKSEFERLQSHLQSISKSQLPMILT